MRTVLRTAAAAASLLLVLAACAADEEPIPEPDEPSDTEAADEADDTEEDDETVADEPEEEFETVSLTFQLNWTWYPADHAYFQVGAAQGFYEDVGLDVTFQEGTGSGTTLSLVGTGDSPLGFVDAGTMMRGVGEGLPVRAIGVITQVSPMAVIFPAEKGYETADDLVGATIAVTFGDALEQVFPAVLGANDIPADDVTMVGTPNPPAKETLVLTGDADALMGYYTEQAPRLEVTQGVEMSWLSFADMGVNTLNMSIVANADWLDENPEVARRFIQATQRAIEFTIENPEQAAEIFSEAHPDFELELTQGQIVESVPLLQTDHSQGQPYLWTAEEDWLETRRLMVDFAELENVADDISEYYTNEFIE